MSTAPVLREQPAGNWAVYVAGIAELRRTALLSVASEHSKRNYAKALDEIIALCEMRQQPTRDRAKELLAVRSINHQGKRDYCILALLVGCALRRRQLSTVTLEDISAAARIRRTPLQRAVSNGKYLAYGSILAIQGGPKLSAMPPL
jgi:hypothetical protein